MRNNGNLKLAALGVYTIVQFDWQSFLLNWAGLFTLHNFLNYRDFEFHQKWTLFDCQQFYSPIFLSICWSFGFGIYGTMHFAMITQSKFEITTNYMCHTEKSDRFSVKCSKLMFVSVILTLDTLSFFYKQKTEFGNYCQRFMQCKHREMNLYSLWSCTI